MSSEDLSTFLCRPSVRSFTQGNSLAGASSRPIRWILSSSPIIGASLLGKCAITHSFNDGCFQAHVLAVFERTLPLFYSRITLRPYRFVWAVSLSSKTLSRQGLSHEASTKDHTWSPATHSEFNGTCMLTHLVPSLSLPRAGISLRCLTSIGFKDNQL